MVPKYDGASDFLIHADLKAFTKESYALETESLEIEDPNFQVKLISFVSRFINQDARDWSPKVPKPFPEL